MKWKKVKDNIVEIEGGDSFVIGVRWCGVVQEKNHLKRKMMLSRQLSSGKIKTGVILNNNKTFAQVGESAPDTCGKPSLAAYLSTYSSANCIYFMKIEDGSFWVVCYNRNGSIEMTSDRIVDFFELRDYIQERLTLAESKESQVVNLGEKVLFDEPDLDYLVEYASEELVFNDKQALSLSQIKTQSGDFNKRLIIGLQLAALSIFGGVYFYLSSESDELLGIKNGEYSAVFSSKYSKVDKGYKLIQRNSKKRKLDRESFIREGRLQFNQHILNRTLSNIEAVERIVKIRHVVPKYKCGWALKQLSLRDDKYYMRFERMGKYPQTKNYKVLNKELKKTMAEKGYSKISQLRLEELGDVVVYEIVFDNLDNPAFTDFMNSKRDIESKRQESALVIRELKKRLDAYNANIKDFESSVAELGVWDKKNRDVISNIVASIDSESNKARGVIKKALDEINNYNLIKDMTIPSHDTYLLPEGGFEDYLYPILQDLPLLTWSAPTLIGGYPTGITDKVFKRERLIKSKGVKLIFDSNISNYNLINPLLEKDYVFLHSLDILVASGQEQVKLSILINEINQDYINK